MQKLGKTLFQTDASHKVAKQYMSLALEVEARVAALTKEDAPAHPDTQSGAQGVANG